MKGLIIAEKPSVMRAIKEVYDKESGYPDVLEFAAFHGHLMELKAPEDYDPAYSKWDNVSLLPISPPVFSYKAQDTKAVADLTAKIEHGHYDYLINACDAGREGEHIFWSFYETVGLTLPVKRFWVSSVTKPALKKALYDLKDSSLYSGLRQAAKYRAQFDWLVGMNLTRAATHQLVHLTSIGRVQTPVLKVIVDREIAIRDFVPKDFFEVKADLTVNGAKAACVHLIAPDHKGTKFSQKKDAEIVANEVKALGTGQVVNTKETVKETDAPTLLSLTELQRMANKRLKFTPDKTLAIAQKLYEAGLLTYPRTESRYLPTDMIPEIPAHIKPLTAVPELASYAAGIGQPEIKAMLGKKYIDDAGITDHHAIIPTDQVPNWASLSKDEQAVYDLVGRSFLAIFMPPHRSASSVILISVGPHLFKGQGRVELDPGYTALYPSKKASAAVLPKCAKGDTATVFKVDVTKGTTTAPARFDPDSILGAMENAGQDLPDSAMRSVLRGAAGIGTPATRADILLKLQKRGYVELKGNLYYALEKGMALIKDIGDRSFASAVLTAQWEEKLREVEQGKYKGDFRAEMDAYVKAETSFLLNNLTAAAGTIVGKCPFCGGDIKETLNGYVCVNKKSDGTGCSVWIPKKLTGHDITPDEAMELLSGKTIGPFRFSSKGKDWTSSLALEQGRGVVFVTPKIAVGKCPVCGAGIVATKGSYMCSRRKKDDPDACPFWIPRAVGGYELSEADVKALLSGKQTEPHTIKTKNGSDWIVSFYLDGDRSFQLKNMEERATVGPCPKCGKPVYASKSNFYCSGYEDKSCDWSMSRSVKKAHLSDTDIKAMLAGGKTKLKTFVWANGSCGQAKLYLIDGDLKWEFPH